MDWKIRPMEKNDLAQIAELQLRVFSKKRKFEDVVKHFEWKYFKNPNGNANCAVAVTSENQIIGIYGSIPYKIKLNDSEAIINYVVTSMVDKDYQRKSILKQLIECYKNEVLKKCQTSICIGFPNPLAYGIGKKHHEYKQILKIYTYKIPLEISSKLDFPNIGNQKKLRPIWQNTILKKLISPIFNYNHYKNYESQQSLQIEEVNQLPKDYDEFWNSAMEGYENIVIRNSDYIKWRFFEDPENKYKFHTIRKNKKLIGYYVLLEGLNTQIHDFLIINEKEIREDAYYCMLAKISKNQEIQTIGFPIYDFNLELILQSNTVQIMNISNFVSMYFSESDQKILNRVNDPAAWYLSGNEFSIA